MPTSDPRPVHERCWCWQWGRCLTVCPTADLPRPVPFTDDNWHRAWIELRLSNNSKPVEVPRG